MTIGFKNKISIKITTLLLDNSTILLDIALSVIITTIM